MIRSVKFVVYFGLQLVPERANSGSINFLWQVKPPIEDIACPKSCPLKHVGIMCISSVCIYAVISV